MPSHHDIRAFTPGEPVDDVYALREVNLLTSSQGKPYLRMTLADATADITANMWDGDEKVFARLRAGEAVRVRGTVESYRGSPQVRVTAVRPAREDEFDPETFIARSPADLEALERELARTVAAVRDADYRRLLRAFFDDPSFMRAFRRAPAAMHNHHAYLGGLLEHTVTICRLAAAVSGAWETGIELDGDLLTAGALLHDVGKTRELAVRTCIQYTDEGGLLGHITIGVLMVQERARSFPDFPPDKLRLLLHMILSHHGQREYGSPVVPCIPEAMVLHHVDNLDAKTTVACRRIAEDTNDGSAWTEWSRMLETRLFKQAATGNKEPSPGGGDRGGKRTGRAPADSTPRTLFDA